eukprot:Skav224172  [mRNA]  locus=scaffold2007:401770:405655:+ [translate_table: standard]
MVVTKTTTVETIPDLFHLPFGLDPDIHCFALSPFAEMQQPPQYFRNQNGQVISPWPYQSGQAVQGSPVFLQAAGAPVVNPMVATPLQASQPVRVVQALGTSRAGAVVPGATYAQAPVTLPATTLPEAKVRTAADCALGPSEAMKRLREGFGQRTGS